MTPTHHRTDSANETSLVHPVRIPTPFAVGDVFSYLLHDEKTVLVDCGHFADTAFERVRKALDEQGLAVEDIDEIWLTHGHPDHFGQAALLADRSGATVRGHPKERANFAGNSDRLLFRDFFEAHGLPGDMNKRMLEQLDWLQQYQQPLQPEWLDEGEVLESGQLRFRVRHLPGHAPGHVAFCQSNAAQRPPLIFGGDVLLEHISTNALINFDPDEGIRNRSLLQYRQSLQWMREQRGLVLPGHGKVIRNIPQVADHHLREQEQRYDKIKAHLRHQPRSLLELSRSLFADALGGGAHFLVFSEVMGYLDWGIAEGEIYAEQAGGITYHPA